MRDLTVTLIQSATRWHDPAGNRAHFAAQLASLQDGGDLVLLPEMFTTGFSMEAAREAETMEGPTVAWMRERAAELDAVVAGSLVIEDGGGVYNRFVWVRPGGAVESYDKRHLFRMAGEHEHYAPGRTRRVLEVGDWRICPQVCYDLRFPVFCRNRNDYDLLVFVANWPAPRIEQWRTLLAARAIENQCYVVGVNVVGTDGAGVDYAGGSAVRDPTGAALVEAGNAPQILRMTLDGEALRGYRERFPAWMDADRHEIAPGP